MLIDTHAHLDADAFDTDLDEVLERARDAGVERILTIGITLETSRNALKLAQTYEQVSAVVGIQPNYASEEQAGDWDEIVAMASLPEVVAVGETGLDRYWDYAPIDAQRELFDRHLELSRQVQKPFVVHCREAEADVVAQLRNASAAGPLNGVMHSFCGDQATAESCLEMGMHLSFAGMLTYRKNDSLRAVAAGVPADRLLVETDSPYLAPQQRRGKRNEPGYVRWTCECLAEQQELSLQEMARITTENAQRVFSV